MPFLPSQSQQGAGATYDARARGRAVRDDRRDGRCSRRIRNAVKSAGVKKDMRFLKSETYAHY